MKKLVYSPDYRDKIIRLKNELDLKYGQPVRKKVLSEINHHIHLLKAHIISLAFHCVICTESIVIITISIFHQISCSMRLNKTALISSIFIMSVKITL